MPPDRGEVAPDLRRLPAPPIEECTYGFVRACIEHPDPDRPGHFIKRYVDVPVTAEESATMTN